ncbi:MAG: hypothetical protein NTW19_09310 [Planctomycetota bacterium]|nr:hypothetical protein [Planctomycetota bacterium]
MPYDAIDATRLQVLPLAARRSYIEIEKEAAQPNAPPPDAGPLAPQIDELANRIQAARSRGASVMLTYGAHLVKNGAGTLLNALIEKGWLTHLATQGAGVIHDWEFAFLGRSSESVRDNAPAGRFGSWDETGKWINLAAIVGAAEGMGLGESVGKMIAEDGLALPMPAALADAICARPDDPLAGARADLLATMRRFGLAGGRVAVKHPYKRYSTLACAYEHRVPLTVHPGIGYDIIVNHPMFHGGAIGRTSGADARVFAHGVLNLTGGVYLSVGSAIMSPQVFEKAFSAANNLLLGEGRPAVKDHTIAIVDLQDGGGWDWSRGEPPKENPAYYLRFCKTFHRMGGRLDYLCGDNRVVLANLLARLEGR